MGTEECPSEVCASLRHWLRLSEATNLNWKNRVYVVTGKTKGAEYQGLPEHRGDKQELMVGSSRMWLLGWMSSIPPHSNSKERASDWLE